MTLQEAIGVLKKNILEHLFSTSTLEEAIYTVVAELEKTTYTAEDMEDFRNWAHWNGYHFILSEKKWYNPFSEENAETRYTIDEVIKLWEESK